MYFSPQTITDHDTTNSLIKNLPSGDSSFICVTNNNLSGMISNINKGFVIGLLQFDDEIPFYFYAKEDGITDLIKIRNGIMSFEDSNKIIAVVPERFKDYVNNDGSLLLGTTKGSGENMIALRPVNVVDKDDEVILNNLKETRWSNEILELHEANNFFGNELVNNTIKKISVSNYSIPNNSKLPLPSYWKGKDFEEYLFNKLDGLGDEYKERLQQELDIILSNNFERIFMIVADYVSFAKIRGVEVGAGRGSVANSLVAFLLGITDIDPLLYNLPFERFLNPDRIKLPDIDIDFESAEIDSVRKYLLNEYGPYSIAFLRVYNRLTSKAAVRAAGKMLKKNNNLVNSMTLVIKDGESLREATQRSSFLNSIFSKDKEFARYCSKLENVKRSESLHPAGLIIDEGDLREKIPVGEKRDGILSCELEEKELSQMGFLKFDLLSLSTLDIIKQLRHESGLDYRLFELNNPDVMNTFQKSQTEGIFQFSSSGAKNTLRKLLPKNIVDLAVASSIFRPGPMNYIDQYVYNREFGFNFNEQIDEILNETKGIIIFQEQFNQIISILKGISFGKADNFRRFISNCSDSEAKSEFRKMYNDSEDIEINNRNFLFSMLFHLKEYSFPKGHALSYAIFSYRLAYYKTHCPSLFVKVSLEHNNGDKEDLVEFAKSKGVKVLPPSYWGSLIRYSTKEILQLGVEDLNVRNKSKIMDIRYREKTGSKEWDLERILMEYCINVGEEDTKKLIFSGFFDEKVSNKKALIQTVDFYMSELDKDFTGEDFEYFGLKPIPVNIEDYSEDVIIQKSREVTGCYIDEKLIDFLASDIKHTKLKDAKENEYRTFVGELTYFKMIKTVKKEDMVFLKIKDETAELDVVVFNNVLELFRNDISKGYYVRLTGRVNKRKGKLQIIAEEVKRI